MNTFVRSKFFQLSIFDDYGSDRETDKKKERQRQIDRAREIERERETKKRSKSSKLAIIADYGQRYRQIVTQLDLQIKAERKTTIDRQIERQIDKYRERERQVSLQDIKITMREDTKYESKDPNIPNCCNREIERQINQIV